MSKPARLGAALNRSIYTRVEPSYSDAINLLNSTQAGFRVLENRKRSGHVPGEESITQMKEWLRLLGYTPHDLNRLNVVHIAGTKGKGSTSSFTSSILNQYRLSPTHTLSPTKIGLYTSPHLTSVRERIRLNDVPISEPAFAAAFFHVWKALGLDSAEPPVDRPTYFRLLTLLSFHVFMSEGVDAAVYEVGVGGEYDATNVFEKVVAAGIVSLGIDHVGVLGGTLGEIAWHKAGIMKSGCPAFTVPQEDAAMKVLRERAGEKGVDLVEVGVHPGLREVKLRPDEEFQRKNASLAIRLAATVMERFGTKVDVSGETLPREVVDGIEKCSWRGRCETIVGDKQTWYLDGAHNEQSLDVACRWFGRVSKERDTPSALIFNQQSDRDAVKMLNVTHDHLSRSNTAIKYAIFCTNITYKNSSTKPDLINTNVDPDVVKKLTLQNTLADVWRTLDPRTEVVVAPSIEEAIAYVREKEEDLQVFITGSLHLVGGALSVLEGEDSGLKGPKGLKDISS
ncbi:Folylpolyglutamate synthase [Scedosporium apiospermum]|uniref:Folylpolyglutamate synthase n=1 Tax=Pseudallescheria apiosperma TaxID=563466 RepID=A0A084GF01_PSEDA|nr:Folylpolyglutamate synthase [Scedosporium apiospermum]KEZ45913.1 Folylpolyglutamate synthase [Scedosporium apiospermum]